MTSSSSVPFLTVIMMSLGSLFFILVISQIPEAVQRVRQDTATSQLDALLDGFKSSLLLVESLTRDTPVIPIHSHNDYWRTHPFYDAVRVGAASVEADIWFFGGNAPSTPLPTYDAFTKDELYVGHSSIYLTAPRTLDLLYLDPITAILDQANKQVPPDHYIAGVFYNSPHTLLLLFIDVKTEANATYDRLVRYLQPLIAKNYLLYVDLDTNQLYTGPITITLTGNHPLVEYLRAHSNRLYTFVDAPLELWFRKNANTSPYTHLSRVASALLRLLMAEHPDVFEGSQMLTTGQVLETERKFLMPVLSRIAGQPDSQMHLLRLWDLPGWPATARNTLYRNLVAMGVGLLNVDDLKDAQALL